MEAKDTVMSAAAVMSIILKCEGTVGDARQKVNGVQAEISFKAGYKQAISDMSHGKWEGK